jgi:hypothetical protein
MFIPKNCTHKDVLLLHLIQQLFQVAFIFLFPQNIEHFIWDIQVILPID